MLGKSQGIESSAGADVRLEATNLLPLPKKQALDNCTISSLQNQETTSSSGCCSSICNAFASLFSAILNLLKCIFCCVSKAPKEDEHTSKLIETNSSAVDKEGETTTTFNNHSAQVDDYDSEEEERPSNVNRPLLTNTDSPQSQKTSANPPRSILKKAPREKKVKFIGVPPSASNSLSPADTEAIKKQAATASSTTDEDTTTQSQSAKFTVAKTNAPVPSTTAAITQAKPVAVAKSAELEVKESAPAAPSASVVQAPAATTTQAKPSVVDKSVEPAVEKASPTPVAPPAAALSIPEIRITPAAAPVSAMPSAPAAMAQPTEPTMEEKVSPTPVAPSTPAPATTTQVEAIAAAKSAEPEIKESMTTVAAAQQQPAPVPQVQQPTIAVTAPKDSPSTVVKSNRNLPVDPATPRKQRKIPKIFGFTGPKAEDEEKEFFKNLKKIFTDKKEASSLLKDEVDPAARGKRVGYLLENFNEKRASLVIECMRAFVEKGCDLSQRYPDQKTVVDQLYALIEMVEKKENLQKSFFTLVEILFSCEGSIVNEQTFLMKLILNESGRPCVTGTMIRLLQKRPHVINYRDDIDGGIAEQVVHQAKPIDVIKANLESYRTALFYVLEDHLLKQAITDQEKQKHIESIQKASNSIPHNYQAALNEIFRDIISKMGMTVSRMKSTD